MYYGLIVLSVVMFGGCFALKDVYGKQRGRSIRASLQYSLIGSVAGLAVLLPINGFSVAITPFAVILAALSALNGFAFSFCSFKALETINLSLYSLFSMLGGMLLPFLQGIIFYDEPFTLAKAVCIILILSALLLTLNKSGTKKRGGEIYYALVFVLNGMSGIISKIFASAPEEWKTASSGIVVSSAGYSVLASACSLVMAAALLPLFPRHKEEGSLSAPSIAVGALSGAINKVANWFLVFALAHGIASSVQYPMVTGGTMIVSTVICFFGKSKPTKREVLSVALAFLGLLALFIIPEM